MKIPPFLFNLFIAIVIFISLTGFARAQNQSVAVSAQVLPQLCYVFFPGQNQIIISMNINHDLVLQNSARSFSVIGQNETNLNLPTGNFILSANF